MFSVSGIGGLDTDTVVLEETELHLSSDLVPCIEHSQVYAPLGGGGAESGLGGGDADTSLMARPSTPLEPSVSLLAVLTSCEVEDRHPNSKSGINVEDLLQDGVDMGMLQNIVPPISSGHSSHNSDSDADSYEARSCSPDAQSLPLPPPQPPEVADATCQPLPHLMQAPVRSNTNSEELHALPPGPPSRRARLSPVGLSPFPGCSLCPSLPAIQERPSCEPSTKDRMMSSPLPFHAPTWADQAYRSAGGSSRFQEELGGFGRRGVFEGHTVFDEVGLVGLRELPDCAGTAEEPSTYEAAEGHVYSTCSSFERGAKLTAAAAGGARRCYSSRSYHSDRSSCSSYTIAGSSPRSASPLLSYLALVRRHISARRLMGRRLFDGKSDGRGSDGDGDERTGEGLGSLPRVCAVSVGCGLVDSKGGGVGGGSEVSARRKVALRFLKPKALRHSSTSDSDDNKSKVAPWKRLWA